MNRASSAVFHFGSEFSSCCPVDAMWIRWKLGQEFSSRPESPQPATTWSADFIQARTPFRLQSLQFCSKFPLFRSAYYYYWFYMFLI